MEEEQKSYDKNSECIFHQVHIIVHSFLTQYIWSLEGHEFIGVFLYIKCSPFLKEIVYLSQISCFQLSTTTEQEASHFPFRA